MAAWLERRDRDPAAVPAVAALHAARVPRGGAL